MERTNNKSKEQVVSFQSMTIIINERTGTPNEEREETGMMMYKETGNERCMMVVCGILMVVNCMLKTAHADWPLSVSCFWTCPSLWS